MRQEYGRNRFCRSYLKKKPPAGKERASQQQTTGGRGLFVLRRMGEGGDVQKKRRWGGVGNRFKGHQMFLRRGQYN